MLLTRQAAWLQQCRKPFSSYRNGTAARATAQRSIRPIADLSHQQLECMRNYIELLLDKNKVMNLTAVTDPQEAWKRHVEDSIALLPTLDSQLQSIDQPRLIDVGSGAGLPGIIIAIARPHWQMTLLDSLQKRCKFVEEAIERLNISNATPFCARAESAGQDPDHREAYDCVLARAVAEMRILAELSLPLVKIGGSLVAAKGPNPQAEVELAMPALEKLGGELKNIVDVDSFSSDGQRTVVVIDKMIATPPKYPRQAGRPQKKPL